MLDAASILAKSRATLPNLADAAQADLITKGGSDRNFWRVSGGSGATVICMEFTTARADNAAFVPVTRFLVALGVPVPALLAALDDEHLVWLEDLGGDDLWAHRNAPWRERRPLYEGTLRAVAKIHAIDEDRLADLDAPRLQPSFDRALYRWEQEYFLNQFVIARLGRDDAAEDLRHSADFTRLAQSLAELPRSLVHRDFQSQNVMTRDGGIFLIDYQGLRLGLPEYDIASLLYDPYVSLSDDEREQLQRFYFGLRALRGDFEKWRQLVHRCAAQRLMQALGAYGYLGLKLGKTEFLKHIPNALENLTSVLDRGALLPELRALLGESA